MSPLFALSKLFSNYFQTIFEVHRTACLCLGLWSRGGEPQAPRLTGRLTRPHLVIRDPDAIYILPRGELDISGLPDGSGLNPEPALIEIGGGDDLCSLAEGDGLIEPAVDGRVFCFEGVVRHSIYYNATVSATVNPLS